MRAQEAWNAAYNQLELQLDRASFDTWLRSAVFLDYRDDHFIIGVQNGYAQDMLQYRMYRSIRRVLSDVYGQEIEIQFEIHKSTPPPVDDSNDTMPLFRLLAQQEQEERASDLRNAVRKPEHPDLPESELNSRFTFNRFITSSSNQVVYEAACAVAENPATVYNPLLVYGGVGLGKTHILQAIAHQSRQRGIRAVFVPSEAFTNDLINAIRNRSTAMFREKYRKVDMLIVDDIQFIGGKETTQEEFFHTFNALANFNKQVILASDRHPRELSTLEDRLRSRFQGGLVVDIQPPEIETRLAILQLWANERQMELPHDMAMMIAERAPQNIRELGGVFNQIVAQMRMSRNQSLSMHRAKATLQQYHSPRERITIQHVIEVTAKHHSLSADDLISKKRASRINQARQMAMYLCRDMTEASLPQIGEAFGKRSHTTILHGCNKVAEQAAYDRVLQVRIQKIQNAIKKGHAAV